MSSPNLLAGRGAVVAGGSRGIGRAVAELLCNLGAGVVVNGRDADAVGETLAAITESGGRATPVIGAADDERVATGLIVECMSTFGRLDTLINCAGIAEPAGSSILTMSPAEFDRLMAAHLGRRFIRAGSRPASWPRKGTGRSSTPARWLFSATTAAPATPPGKARSTD